MTLREQKLKDAELADMFEAARAETLPMSDTFMAQLMMDADAELEAQGAAVPAWAQSSAPQARPFMERVLEFLGGWRGATGLATATLTGLVVGLGAPSTVSNVASGYWATSSDLAYVQETAFESAEVSSYALDDLVPSFYDLAVEG